MKPSWRLQNPGCARVICTASMPMGANKVSLLPLDRLGNVGHSVVILRPAYDEGILTRGTKLRCGEHGRSSHSWAIT